MVFGGAVYGHKFYGVGWHNGFFKRAVCELCELRICERRTVKPRSHFHESADGRFTRWSSQIRRFAIFASPW